MLFQKKAQINGLMLYDLLDDETKNNPAAYPSDSILDKCVLFTNLNQETLKLYESAFTEVLSQ